MANASAFDSGNYFDGIARGHKCPACGTQTLSLPAVLRASQDGKLPLNLKGAIPDSQQVARWLKPPDVPKDVKSNRPDIWGPKFFLAVSMVVMVLCGLMLSAILSIPIGIIVTLLAMGAVYYRIRRTPISANQLTGEHERTLALKTWDRRMEIWERLGVCPQCGLLSDPMTGRTAEWHSVPNLFVS